MKHYNKLTKKRKAFIEQLYNLINTQFEEQEKLKELKPFEIIEELENNSEYIQRIFIDAPWGMGKTYFAKSLKELIDDKNSTREKKINFININAWETDYFSDPMKCIIGEINSHNLLNSETQNIIENLLKNIFKTGVKFFSNLILKKFNLNDEEISKLKSIFNGINYSELDDYKDYKELVSKFKECLSQEKELKVILIDELDRCKPNYAIELLETVKHFLGVKNIIFVFLVNKEQLKSIVSTSYLTDDNCTEYFEKFFDIQFKLPELEYEDFIEIEYNKYNDIHTYNIKPYPPQNNIINNFFNNIKIDYIADDVNSFYELLFLEAFKSNYDSSIVSPRNLIKSFRKFRLLLSSLSLKEKRCYPLMIVLVLYFIREEFLIKNNTKNNFKILDLYLKTFFNQNTLKKVNNFNNIEDDFYEYFSAKKLFYNFQEFYKTLYFILYYPSGKENIESRHYYIMNYNIYRSTLERSPTNQVILNINNIIIQNKNIYYYLFCNQHGEIYFYLDYSFFQNRDIEKYTLKNDYISSNIMEIWAKDKYEFILLQQSKENN